MRLYLDVGVKRELVLRKFINEEKLGGLLWIKKLYY